MNYIKRLQLKDLKVFKRHLGLKRYLKFYSLILINKSNIIINDQDMEKDITTLNR